MQTPRYPLWKSIAWVLMILAYGLQATVLSALVAQILLHEGVGADPRFYLTAWVIVALWVGLLAVAAWQVMVRRHKTAGRTLVVMAGIAAILSLYLGSWLSTGKWWLGWVGARDPLPVIHMCHHSFGGCPDFQATETAAAPHPPAWWPWGNPVTLNLIDFGIHPELYQGRTVTTEGEILSIYSPTEFYIGSGSIYGGAHVVASDPSSTKDIHEGDMVWLKGIAGGDCKNHYSSRYSTDVLGIICAEEIRDLGQ